MKKILLHIMIFIGIISQGSESRFIEAECFDKLPQSGIFQNMPGWYAKRHSHASGGAFVVCHYSNAKMLKEFKTLPPGNYDVCLRVVRNRSANTQNKLNIELGSSAGGKFSTLASADISLCTAGSGYGWEKIPVRFKIAKNATAIRLTSQKVECKGIGDDPEFQLPYIIIDSIVITNADIKITGIKNRKGRTKLFFLNKAEDPRNKYAKIPYPKITPQLHYNNLPARKFFLSNKNLLRNSGFEMCLKGNFGSFNPRLTGYNLDADCLEEKQAFEGRYCVRLKGKVSNPLSDYTGSKGKIIYGNGFKLTTFNRFKSNVLRKLVREPLIFSIYARTNGKAVTLNIAGKSFKVSHTDWRRYSTVFNPKVSKNNIVSFKTDDPEAEVFLDAMQLERGKVAKKYIPLEGIEAGFQTHARANIFYNSKEIPMELVVTAGQKIKSQTLVIKYKILDYSLRICAQGKYTIKPEPGKTVYKKVLVPFQKLGGYLFVYEIENHPEQAWAFPIGIIKKSSRPLKSLGVIGSSNSEFMKIARYVGIGRMLSLNDNITYFNILWPDEDSIRIYDKYLKMWQDKYGIDYVFHRPPFNPPKWTPSIIGKGAAAHMGKKNIDYIHWAELWDTLTKKMRYIKYWMPSDELGYHRAPAEASEYISIATEKIRKNSPDSTVINSTQALSLREMLRVKPDLDIGDAIGGSRHGNERNMFFYDLQNKLDLNKKFWIIGVGWLAPGWTELLDFETFTVFAKHKARWPLYTLNASKVVSDIFEEMAVVGVDQYCLYTAKFDAGNDPWSTFSPLNTFRPFGVNYVNAVKFLKGAKRGGTILLDKANGISASYVLRNGKTCVMIKSSGRFSKTDVQVNLPSAKVNMYDGSLNLVKFVNKFELSPDEVVFIEDNGFGHKKLLAAIQQISAGGKDNERRLIMHGSGRALQLVIFKNGKKVSSKKLPADAGIKYSLDQSRHDRVSNWACIAPEAAAGGISLDGKLTEAVWNEAAPSFIYSIPYLNGSYGALQGIKNFSTIESAEDLSATFNSAWDKNALYFGIKAYGTFKEGSVIKIKLDADLLGDINQNEYNGDDYMISIPITNTKGTFSIDIKNFNGNKCGYCKAVQTTVKGGKVIELKIPFSQINLKDGAGALGLNIEISDIMSGKRRTLSWTTNYAAQKSPAGFGQLILVNPQKR